MQTLTDSTLPGESILTFGVRNRAGFVTISAQTLSSQEVVVLLRHVAELAARVDGNLALDIAMVSPVNCSWINGFIELNHRCRRMGGRLVLTGVPEDAWDILRSTGLDKRLEVALSRQDALVSLHQPEKSPSLFGWLRPGKTKAA